MAAGTFSSTALIVGGTSGIGLHIGAQLAEAGVATLVINGRDPARGEAACRAIRKRAPHVQVHFIAADVSIREGVETLRRRLSEWIPGPLGSVANCVGADHVPKLFRDVSDEEVEGIVRQHLLSTIHVCRAVLPLLARGSSVINIASDAAKAATPGETVVGAAMAGIVMFSKTLAMELKREGIRVNALTPSLVKDTLSYERVTAGGFSAKLFEKAAARAQLGVPGPADVAAMAVFLLSSSAAHVTGQAISVNGGISAA